MGMKTLDYNGLKNLVSLIDEKYEVKLPNGNAGQVLTKTANGVEFQDVQKSEGGTGITKITHRELCELKYNNNLVPGAKYRITDYDCVPQFDCEGEYRCAGHRFDIIVSAISENELDACGRAINHEYTEEDLSEKVLKTRYLYFYYKDTDIEDLLDDEYLLMDWESNDFEDIYKNYAYSDPEEDVLYDKCLDYQRFMEYYEKFKEEQSEIYFKYTKLNEWRVWYKLWDDNKYGDYDSHYYDDLEYKEYLEIPKGVIYRLIDEHQNDVCYDFKNIQFIRSVAYDEETGYENYEYFYNSERENFWNYTFQEQLGDDAMDKTILERWVEWDYVDAEIQHDNFIGGAGSNRYSIYSIPNVVMCEFCFNNVVSGGSTQITFGDLCAYNDILYSCENIFMAYGSVKNTFETDCRNICLYGESIHNLFTSNCCDITLGNATNCIFGEMFEDFKYPKTIINKMIVGSSTRIKFDFEEVRDINNLIIDDNVQELRIYSEREYINNVHIHKSCTGGWRYPLYVEIKEVENDDFMTEIAVIDTEVVQWQNLPQQIKNPEEEN